MANNCPEQQQHHHQHHHHLKPIGRLPSTPCPENNLMPVDGFPDGPSAAAAVGAAQGDGKKHLLLAASGSVAVIKIPSIVAALAPHAERLSVRIVLTASAARFFTGASAEQPSLAELAKLSGVDAVYTDEHEWAEPWRRGADILHINLRRWADLMVVAPLSANTLAKVVGGVCDNLLTCVIRAWDPQRGRIVVAPAMNSLMWTHPITARQIRVLEDEWGVGGKGGDSGWFEVLAPAEKLLACGDSGVGAMAEWHHIVLRIEQRLGLSAEQATA